MTWRELGLRRCIAGP